MLFFKTRLLGIFKLLYFEKASCKWFFEKVLKPFAEKIKSDLEKHKNIFLKKYGLDGKNAKYIFANKKKT